MFGLHARHSSEQSEPHRASCERSVSVDLLDLEVVSSQLGVIDRQVEGAVCTGGLLDLKHNRSSDLSCFIF